MNDRKIHDDQQDEAYIDFGCAPEDAGNRDTCTLALQCFAIGDGAGITRDEEEYLGRVAEAVMA